RPGWIAFGWFIAVSLTALVLLALAAARLVEADTPVEGVWVSLSNVFGFALAGFLVGTRVNAAPTLHGIGIGLFSLVAWAGLNLFLGEPTGLTAWDTLDAGVVVALLLLQMVAAIVGARMGVRW